jgi:hypothetical protein
LIELHRSGPRFNFQIRQDQRGYIAIEWWDDDFVAVRYASSRGVIVVEAAGNGAETSMILSTARGLYSSPPVRLTLLTAPTATRVPLLWELERHRQVSIQEDNRM